jgi:4-amino-4-deoxy-L-arabinose transferase-like glycosyltransferase
VTPRLNGVLYFEKPPLYYWMVAGSLALFGMHEAAVRLPSAVAGLAGLLLALALGRAMGGARAGARAALLLGVAPLYVVLARLDSLDMTVSLLLAATLGAFWLAHRRPADRTRRLLWHGMFLAAALAVLAKGLIGIVIPGAIVVLYLAWTREWGVLRQVPWVTGTLLFLVVAAPWHVLMALRHPATAAADGFLWFYFVHEHLLRYTTAEAQRGEPFWYLLAVLAVGLLPWSGLLPATARLLRHEDLERRRTARFLVCWAGFVVLFFSVSRSKLAPYVLPAAMPLALLVALVLEDAAARGTVPALLRRGLLAGALVVALLGGIATWVALGRAPRLLAPGVAPWAALPAVVAVVAASLALRGGVGAARAAGALPIGPLLVAGGALCATLVLLTPAVGAARSTDALAPFLRQRLAAGDDVIAFGGFPESLEFYLQRPIDCAAYHGELEWGIAQLPAAERRRRFPSSVELAPRWYGSRRTYAVLRERALDRMHAEGLATGPVLARQGALVLVSNDVNAPAPALPAVPPPPRRTR